MKKKLLEIINTGKRFYFGTGLDGEFNIQIRLINGTEPVLDIKEYKLVEASTRPIVLSIPSGYFKVTDYAGLYTDEGVTQNVTPGNYKIAVYNFHRPNKFQSYYVVLCPTHEAPHNQVFDLDNL